MAFMPTKLARWFVFALILGGHCPFFAQTAPIDSNLNNLWNSVESLLGYPDRPFAPNKLPSDALLDQAEAYILAFKYDSAILSSNRMFHALKQQNQLDSPFGLKVQLVLAKALEQNDADSISLRLLLHVKENSQKEGLWETYVKCGLALALAEEYRDHNAQCLQQLNQVKSAIDRYDLQAFYPEYALRFCSYYRVLVHNRDSAAYYAKEVLRTAPAQNKVHEEAWGRMLLAWMLYRFEDAAFLEHHRAAAALFLKIENYSGLSFAYREISAHYSHSGDLNKAMVYNDSSRIAAEKSILQGNKWNPELYRSYKFRAELFRQMGRYDSVWYYLNKSHELEINIVREKESAKVADVDARYLNKLKTRQIQEQSEAITVEKRAKRMLFVVVAIVFLLAAGLAVGLVKYMNGMRILAEKNKIIQQQSEQLKSLDEAKSRFFANVSHELRTPLTLLTSPIQTLLKENHLSEKQTQLLQMAERSGKQLSQLINEILDLRKLEMGKMTVVPEPTDLRTWFQAYFAQFESLAGQNQIDYKITLDIPAQTIAELDREKCRQLLFNLLSNAFKFTPNGGRIEARVKASEQRLQLQVANSGPGIHPDDLPHVFDRYFQSNRPDKPVEGGTGIGLALCREYEQLFGGSILVESTPGVDTVFRVTFPLHRSGVGAEAVALPVSPTFPPATEAASVTLLSGASLVKSTARQARILLVEDNPDLREYIRLVLQDQYEVITAEHGQAALNLLQGGSMGRSGSGGIQKMDQAPDLILSDLMMPVMDGYQLLEKLKSDDATRHIPVIMLTARAEAQDKLKALRIGVDDYLTKPFDEEELLARIENLLHNQTVRRQAITEDLPPSEAAAPLLSQPDREWLETFEAYVQKHFSSDLLSVSSLANTFAMSESTLLRQLKRLTGLSPLQYVQEVRLNEAWRLLETRRYNSIAQVASRVGYEDARTFTRSFKQRFGKLPSEFSAG